MHPEFDYRTDPSAPPPRVAAATRIRRFLAGAVLALTGAVPLAAQGIDGLAPLRPGETASTLDLAVAQIRGGGGSGGGAAGDITSHSFHLSALVRGTWNERNGWSIGFASETHRFDKPGGTPLPEWLGATTLNLGFTHRRDERWTWLSRVALGSFSDLSSLRSDTWNASGVVGFAYTPRREFTGFGGVLVNGFAEHPVLPIAGVRWQFAPRWTLNLLYPAPRLEFRASEDLRIEVGLFREGGAFRVAGDFGRKFGRPTLDNALVDYSAWGFGPGITWRLGENSSLALTAGRTFRREWDFHRAGFELQADDAWFARAGLTARF